HVDCLRLAVSHRERARLDQSHHVGESADLFHLAAERLPESNLRIAGHRRQSGGNRMLRLPAAARLGSGGEPEEHRQQRMKTVLPALSMVVLILSAGCRT